MAFLSISLTSAVPKVDLPKLSAIEIKLLAPHLAHAVAGGPYTGVDVDGDGFGVVSVDSSESHTHATGKALIDWTWKEGATIIGQGETTSLTLPVGNHTVSLTVVDDGGNDSTEDVLVTVNPIRISRDRLADSIQWYRRRRAIGDNLRVGLYLPSLANHCQVWSH